MCGLYFGVSLLSMYPTDDGQGLLLHVVKDMITHNIAQKVQELHLQIRVKLLTADGTIHDFRSGQLQWSRHLLTELSALHP